MWFETMSCFPVLRPKMASAPVLNHSGISLVCLPVTGSNQMWLFDPTCCCLFINPAALDFGLAGLFGSPLKRMICCWL